LIPRDTLRAHALAVHAAALRAADPADAVERRLRSRPLPDGPVVLVGAGKAAGTMAAGAVRVLGGAIAAGCVVVADPSAVPPLPGSIRVWVGDHPVPGPRSLAAGQALLGAVAGVPPGAPILGLWSGGASALVEVLRDGVTLGSLADETRRWLADGAPITEVNQRRRARSALKGGGLARATRGRLHNLVVSDVPGDDPAVVGSGPAVLPGDGSAVVASSADALRGAERAARGLGYATVVLDAAVSGAARQLGERLAAAVRALPDGAPPMCLLCAGEPTVEVRGAGTGGRMQESALSAALGIDGCPAVVLCASTDGRDGPTDAAGALVDGTTAARLRAAGVDGRARLDDNDSGPALAAVGDLVRAAPTGTNVADLVVVLVG
jgi:glycerate 2-kinase